MVGAIDDLKTISTIHACEQKTKKNKKLKKGARGSMHMFLHILKDHIKSKVQDLKQGKISREEFVTTMRAIKRLINE